MKEKRYWKNPSLGRELPQLCRIGSPRRSSLLCTRKAGDGGTLVALVSLPACSQPRLPWLEPRFRPFRNRATPTWCPQTLGCASRWVERRLCAHVCGAGGPGRKQPLCPKKLLCVAGVPLPLGLPSHVTPPPFPHLRRLGFISAAGLLVGGGNTIGF